MTVTYHKMPKTDGVEQIGTIWKFYIGATDTTPFNTTEIRKPKDLFSLTNNIAIPVNETYYVTATRITRLVDEDGNPEKDDGGNDIIQLIEPSKRSPITNEEGLQSVNVYLTPLSEQPMLKHTKTTSGDIVVESSTILPDALTLDMIYWTVYGDGNLVWSKEQTDLTTTKLTIPHSDVVEYNEMMVTAIHISGGVASPIAKHAIDGNVKIIPISGRSSISSLSDYFFMFKSNIQGISSLISRVELVDLIDDTLIATLYPTMGNTVNVEAKYLEENRSYDLRFIMHGPTTTEGNTEIERIRFKTMELTTAPFLDKEHKYNEQFVIETDSSLVELNNCQLEKRPDGRFLTVHVNDDLTTTLKWNTMEKGNIKLVGPIATTVGIRNTGHTTVNIMNDYFIMAYTNDSDGKDTISVCHDNFLGQSIDFLVAFTVTDGEKLNFSSITFDPITSYVYFSTNNNLYKFGVHKHMTSAIVHNLLARPDDIVDGTMFIAVDDNILVLGGSSDSSYFYNPDQDRYEFASVVPSEFAIDKMAMTLINGDVMLSPYNVENNNKTLIYETRYKRFKVVETDTFVSNITGTLKSNGVTLVTNGSNLAGYYI